MAEGTFDVVLLGYRNDIAQARTLEFLDQLPLQARPALLDRSSGLPQRLFAALDREPAQRLRATLEALGAQVTLVAAGPVETQPPAAVLAMPVADRSPLIRPLTLVLLLALGGAVSLWTVLQPVPHHETTPVRRGATHPERMSARIEHAEKPEAVQLNADAVDLAAAHEFEDAAERLRSALRLAPGDPVLTRNLQTVLLNWGVADLGAERLGDATEHLRAAADLGERGAVLRTLGIAALRAGDFPAAAAALERALQLMPADTDALLALADVYLKQDKRPQALDLLQRAKEAGARVPELEKKVQHLSREVDAEWDFVQTESLHFRVSFADSEDTHAVGLVLATLEDAYDVVGVKFDYYPDSRTPVVLYAQQDFHTVTQTPDWAGAAFDGRIKLPVRGLQANDAALPRVLRHEYAHSVVQQLSNGRCPVWLNEGLAVWAEEAEEGEREAWAEQKIAGQELFTLDQLNGSFVDLPATRAEVAYAQSYLAVRALIDDYGSPRISTLLRALGRSRTIGDAFAAVYPDDLPGFQERLLRQLGG